MANKRISRGHFIAVGASLLAACSGGQTNAPSNIMMPELAPGQTLAGRIAGKWSTLNAETGARILDLVFPAAGAKVHAQMLLSGRVADPRGAVQNVVVTYGSDTRAAIERQAGTIALIGYPRISTGVAAGLSGVATFVSNSDYRNQLLKSKFPITTAQLLAFAIWDVSLTDVSILRSAFPNIAAHSIVAVHVFGYSAKAAAGLKQELPTMTVRELSEFMVHRITTDDVQRFKLSSPGDVRPADVLKAQLRRLG